MRFTRRTSIPVTLAGAAYVANPSSALTHNAAGEIHKARRLGGFRRGIGVSHVTGWADVDASGKFSYPAFTGEKRAFTSQQFEAILSAGFDFIRLAVDPGPFFQFTNRDRSQLIDRISQTMRAIRINRFGLIIDIHPSDMNSDYLTKKITDDINGRLFTTYLAFLKLLARTMRSSQISLQKEDPAKPLTPPPLALELFNEPELEASAWQPMLEAAYNAVRSVAPDLPLLIGGGRQNAAEALLEVDTNRFSGDKNLFYTFHDYEPWQFTHQGVVGNPASKIMNLSYPASEEVVTKADSATRQQIMRSSDTVLQKQKTLSDTRRHLDSYLRIAYNARSREVRYDRIAKWADAMKLDRSHVILGEFGVHRLAASDNPGDSMARRKWLNETREAAEKNGFGWCVWVYAAPGGFGLTRDDGSWKFDDSVLSALGLTS